MIRFNYLLSKDSWQTLRITSLNVLAVNFSIAFDICVLQWPGELKITRWWRHMVWHRLHCPGQRSLPRENCHQIGQNLIKFVNSVGALCILYKQYIARPGIDEVKPTQGKSYVLSNITLICTLTSRNSARLLDHVLIYNVQERPALKSNYTIRRHYNKHVRELMITLCLFYSQTKEGNFVI